MGNKQSGVFKGPYSVPVTDNKKEGETEVFRNPLYKEQLASIPKDGYTTMKDMVIFACTKFQNHNCLGVKNPQTNKYEWTSYSEVFQTVKNLGSGISNLGLAPLLEDSGDLKLKCIAIYGKNSPEWLYSDYASALYGFSTVALYDTLGSESMQFILEQTQLSTIICSKDCAKNLVKEEGLQKVSNIVSFSDFDKETKEALEAKGYKLYTFAEVLASGKEKEVDFAEIGSKDVFTFSYTSGTTGNPKGAMLTHGNLIAMKCALEGAGVLFNPSDRHLSYLPLAHIFEKCVSMIIFSSGASIGYYSGDTQKIKEDMAVLKPTFFPSVPRLYNKFYELMTKGINNLTGLKKKLADRAIASKHYYLKEQASYHHAFYDKLVFGKIAAAFGGQVKLMVTAAAPISGEVLDFLKIATSCPIMEAYGQTESTGGSFATHLADPTYGHVGGPTACTEFKLEDVSEMNYTSKDKNENGEYCPRGEVCIRGPSVFRGYYKDEEKTKEAIDQDGWLHTGDVGMLLPNGALKIIDRKKNIFKLAQGEYVAAEKIEIIINRTNEIEESFVYGDSLQTYVVAVIKPQKAYIEKVAGELGIEGDFDELLKNEKVKEEVVKFLTKWGKENKLISYEIPRKVHLISSAFGDHDLLTSTFKLKRHQAKTHFIKELDFMYSTPF